MTTNGLDSLGEVASLVDEAEKRRYDEDKEAGGKVLLYPQPTNSHTQPAQNEGKAPSLTFLFPTWKHP